MIDAFRQKMPVLERKVKAGSGKHGLTPAETAVLNFLAEDVAARK